MELCQENILEHKNGSFMSIKFDHQIK